jgi:hypothetical protein
MDKQPDSVQPDNNQVCDVGAAVMRQHQYWLRPENVARQIHQHGGWSTIGSAKPG